MSDLDGFGSEAKPFVENPYTALLKEVHWPTGVTGLAVNILAHLTGPPITVEQDNHCQMIVSVTNLPELRTVLTVPFISEESGLVVYIDHVSGSFADGTGGLEADYHFQMDETTVIPHVQFTLTGDVFYETSASGDARFGGADSIAISVTLQTTEFYTGTWTAHASSSITPTQSLSGSIAGAATVTADLTLNPPSLSFG